jgi:hypothetical protein
MLKPILNLPQGIVGARAEGRLSRQDFHSVIEPLIENIRRRGLPTRLIIQFGPSFEEIEGGVPWNVLKEGLRTLHQVDRCAFVGDSPRIRGATPLTGALLACALRYYADSERLEALRWLSSRPTMEPKVPSIRILPDQEALLFEFRGRLTSEDLVSARRIARHWIGVGGRFQTLIFYGTRFPGWEDPGAIESHWRFLRDELPQFRRVAVATRGPLGAHFTSVGEGFVDAEIRLFGPGRLYEAMSWAEELAGGAERKEPTEPPMSPLQRALG